MKHIEVSRQRFVNGLGGFGYLVTAVGWALLLIVLVHLVTNGAVLPEYVATTSNVGNVGTSDTPGSLALRASSYITAALMVAIGLVAAVLLPYWVGKWASRLVKFVMRRCGIDTTRQSLLLVKSLAAALPTLGMLIINLVARPELLSFVVVFGVTIATTIVAGGAFVAQTLLARRCRVMYDVLW